MEPRRGGLCDAERTLAAPTAVFLWGGRARRGVANPESPLVKRSEARWAPKKGAQTRVCFSHMSLQHCPL